MRSYVSSASTGNGRIIDLAFFKELCRVLKCSPNYLIGIGDTDAYTFDSLETDSRKVDRLITKLQKVSSETIDNLNNMNKQ